MKNRKWLLIIVIFVMLINLSFFFLIRLSIVKKAVEKKVSGFLTETLQAEVKFGSFSFNDKQLRISDLQVSSLHTFALQIEQIYIEYNLAQLLLSNFKHLHAIKHIKIYEPVLQYSIQPSQKEKEEKKTAELPDISGYFRKLDIYDGKVTIEFNSDDFQIAKEFHDVNLSIINDRDTRLTLRCSGTKADSVFARAHLANGELRKANLEINNFSWEAVDFAGIQDFSAALNLELEYQQQKPVYSGSLQKIELTAMERSGKAETLEFEGDDARFSCHIKELLIDGNRMQFHAEVENPFSPKRTVSSHLTARQIPLHKYTTAVRGFADLKAEASGSPADLLLSFQVESDSLFSQNQVISQVRIAGKMHRNLLTFSLKNAGWEGNTITGEGRYEIGKGLTIDLKSHDLIWQKHDHTLRGDLQANLNLQENMTAAIKITDCDYSSSAITLDKLTLSADLQNKDFNVSLVRDNEDLQITCRGILKPPAAEVNVKFKRFDLKTILHNNDLPIISGNIDAVANEFSLILDSDLRAYDQDFGKLNGRISTNLTADLVNDHFSISMSTHNGKFNYEDFEIELIAEGTLDSINIQNFSINNSINADGWCKWKPELEYGFGVRGKNIKVRDVAKYFMGYYAYSNLQGNADVQIDYDSRNDGKAEGSISFEKLKIGDMQDFKGQLQIIGTNESIALSNGFVNCGEDRILDLSGMISLLPEFRLNAAGTMQNASLQSIFPQSDIKGDISGSFNFHKSAQQQFLAAELAAQNLKKNHLKIDRMKLNISQKDSLLIINEFLLENDRFFRMDGSGAIGYNFITSENFPDSNTVNIGFQGDLLEFLSTQTDAVKSGKSECEFHIKFGIMETGVFIDDCHFQLKKGKLQIKDQPTEIDKINIEFDIKNDILTLREFDLKTADGKLYITNLITETADDFLLGSLNLGKFLVKTNTAGLMVYIPQYTPKNSFVNAVITGRNSDYLEITGPFDDLKILGDIIVFNGNLIYPPDTDNLMNLFNLTITEKKDHSEANPLPLSFDLLLHVGENVRYVTFPVNVKVNQEGYLHLKYQNGEFQKPDAFFAAEEGSVDMFGTTLILDFMQIQLSQFGSGANISGLFYKKAADGTLITLEIFNDSGGDGSFGNLKFALKSDNPTDMTTDILAKLRFNRTMDEISPAQKKSLLQDEVIQIAGLGIESAVLDPLISPVENTIRQILRLDYFHLQTDLIQNLFANYSSESKSEYTITEEQSQVDKFTSEMFLNNLSVSAGKYLTRKLFFDYELRLEKEDQIATETYLGVYQDFKLRYDLPWKFKISYQYLILPFDEKNQHQIGLERSFKF